MQKTRQHTFIAYVEDLPGVLARVVSLFRRRGYNIESLTVGKTEMAGVSRMTIVVEATNEVARNLEHNLYKLINVLWVRDLTEEASVTRDLALIKVRTTAETRPQILQLCEVFRARAVDVTHGALIAEITGTRDKIDGLIDVLRPFGLLEMVRTGLVAMSRGDAEAIPPEALPPKRSSQPPLTESDSDNVTSNRAAEAHVLPENETIMAKMHYEKEADLGRLSGRKVAIIGYGSQGHAHALNLKDSGVDVRVGLPEGSKSRARAEQAGLRAPTVSEAAAEADVIMLLAPDTSQPGIYRESIAPHLRRGKTLMFAHGFNIRFGTITPPDDVDVSMVAPKGPGHRVRETFEGGAGVPALLAVHRDASGNAFADALAYAKGIGATRAGVLETSFSEETETDLFGEQAVLCGGVSALVKAGFETLVEAGYQPEVAYFECLHELKLIVDLMQRGGLNYMRYSISDTAEYGDYVSGPRVIDDRVKATMKQLLTEVRDGTFARRWIAENEAGRPEFEKMRARDREHLIERVGEKLRAMMPFLDPVKA